MGLSCWRLTLPNRHGGRSVCTASCRHVSCAAHYSACPEGGRGIQVREADRKPLPERAAHGSVARPRTFSPRRDRCRNPGYASVGSWKPGIPHPQTAAGSGIVSGQREPRRSWHLSERKAGRTDLEQAAHHVVDFSFLPLIEERQRIRTGWLFLDFL